MFSQLRPTTALAATLITGLVAGATLAGCTGEEAIPIDPANPPTTPTPDPSEIPDVSHPLEPTEQMRELARQQCLDDADLVEGYVSAVDPNTNEILIDFSVECETVRP